MFSWCKHDYKPIKAEPYYDVSYGDRVPSTYVVMKCSKCKKIVTKWLYGAGFLSLEDVS